MVLPRLYKSDELEVQAEVALRTFVKGRFAEGTGHYRRAFLEARSLVVELFASTDNLRRLTPQAVIQHPHLIEAARFLAGPPLSQDDLNALAGGKAVNRRLLDENTATRVISAIRAFLDPFRCAWLESGAAPRRGVVAAAVDWTASLWAVERCRTSRRRESSVHQERGVADLLKGRGLKEEPGIRRIQALDELPRRHFTHEVVLGSPKADLAVRLADGRLLAIECKVSNSAINSVKRLNRETIGKAQTWRQTYGQQVVTAAVLGGVFKVSSLVGAQEAGVFIFWEHDLSGLAEFVAATCA